MVKITFLYSFHCSVDISRWTDSVLHLPDQTSKHRVVTEIIRSITWTSTTKNVRKITSFVWIKATTVLLPGMEWGLNCTEKWQHCISYNEYTSTVVKIYTESWSAKLSHLLLKVKWQLKTQNCNPFKKIYKYFSYFRQIISNAIGIGLEINFKNLPFLRP